MIVGDAIGNGHLALERPDWPSGADQEPEKGIATRTELLAELAETGLLMVGFHLPSGGMGRIGRIGRNGRNGHAGRVSRSPRDRGDADDAAVATPSRHLSAVPTPAP